MEERGKATPYHEEGEPGWGVPLLLLSCFLVQSLSLQAHPEGPAVDQEKAPLFRGQRGSWCLIVGYSRTTAGEKFQNRSL